MISNETKPEQSNPNINIENNQDLFLNIPESSTIIHESKTENNNNVENLNNEQNKNEWGNANLNPFGGQNVLDTILKSDVKQDNNLIENNNINNNQSSNGQNENINNNNINKEDEEEKIEFASKIEISKNGQDQNNKNFDQIKVPSINLNVNEEEIKKDGNI